MAVDIRVDIQVAVDFRVDILPDAFRLRIPGLEGRFLHPCIRGEDIPGRDIRRYDD